MPKCRNLYVLLYRTNMFRSQLLHQRVENACSRPARPFQEHQRRERFSEAPSDRYPRQADSRETGNPQSRGPLSTKRQACWRTARRSTARRARRPVRLQAPHQAWPESLRTVDRSNTDTVVKHHYDRVSRRSIEEVVLAHSESPGMTTFFNPSALPIRSNAVGRSSSPIRSVMRVSASMRLCLSSVIARSKSSVVRENEPR